VKILINADDFGMHSDVNAGIIYAFNNGIVQSTSILASGAACLEAVQLAKQYPELEVGLHFNISHGHCSSEPAKIPLLVDEDGLFLFDSSDMRSSFARFRELANENNKFLDQIRREFFSQIDRLDRLGVNPKHLDFHHYINLINQKLFAQYCKFGDELGIPLRGICQPVMQNLHIPSSSIEEMQCLLRAASVRSPEISISNLISMNDPVIPDSQEYEKRILLIIDQLEMDGFTIVELITHPARITTEFLKIDDYIWARELETTLVTSPTFKKSIQFRNYEVISHADLRQNIGY
jgi:predicted glycoside hydrolase/deacetylase ChbG (UPF0249 family)